MCFILTSGILNEALGRKKTLVLGQTIILIGWSLIYFTKSYELLVFARFFMGIGAGLCYPTTYMYLSEIALVKYRGSVSILNTTTVNIAHIYTILLLIYFEFDGFVGMATLPGILFCILIWFLPESPIWLSKKDNIEEAEKSLVKLRGSQYENQYELNEILEVLNQNQGEKLLCLEKLKQLMASNVLKPFLMIASFYTLQVSNF